MSVHFSRRRPIHSRPTGLCTSSHDVRQCWVTCRTIPPSISECRGDLLLDEQAMFAELGHWAGKNSVDSINITNRTVLTALTALTCTSRVYIINVYIVMVAVWNRAGHYIFALWFLSFYLFSSPNLSGRRLDVYHTSIHYVALVRI